MASSQWQVASGGSFSWRQWAGLAVVFVHATGDTHALSTEATAVLARMIERADTALYAAEWMADIFPQFDQEDFSVFEELLSGLAVTGVVRRIAA
jgi:hypothetical protein